MKKILLLFFICLLIYPSKQIKAQVRFGLKFSPSIAWLKPNSKGILNDGARMKFSYGAVVEYTLTSKYAFATGVDIAYKGGLLKTTYEGNNHSTTNYRLQYIEIPLTMKMRTSELGPVMIWAQIGVAPAINIRALADVSGVDSLKNNYIRSRISPVMAAMYIAIGTEYPLQENTTLFAGFTFNNGFTNIFKKSWKNDEGMEIKNNRTICNYLALTFGLMF